jgi:uncharacterized protein (TIGR04255 family)
MTIDTCFADSQYMRKDRGNSGMAEGSPKFDRPPVTETVISAQFSRLENFSAAHAGWFWKKHLLEEWTKVQETFRLDDQFELFDEGGGWVRPALRLSDKEKARIQFTGNNDERMIQVQDTRFILNWRKRKADYPTYKKLFGDFSSELHKFQGFAREADLGAIEFNQWEMTYVNSIPKGELWEKPSDWSRIVPTLALPAAAKGVSADTMGGNWRFVLDGQRGRLYVTARHLRKESGEVLSLELTARGPVREDTGQSLDDGLSIGHSAIVWTFVALTSPMAQEYWGRRLS